VIVVPALLAILPAMTLKIPNVRINLSNGEYWLDPSRRAETIQFLCTSMRRFAFLLLAFFSYLHWLVVRANQVIPPTFPKLWFIGGFGVFLLATLLWAAIFIGHFLDVPD
jgi:hypothetical protein